MCDVKNDRKSRQREKPTIGGNVKAKGRRRMNGRRDEGVRAKVRREEKDSD